MTHYKKLKLTHANLQRPVHIVLGTISAYHDHKNDNGARMYTAVYTTAGIFPAEESIEQIDELINRLTKGEVNE